MLRQRRQLQLDLNCTLACRCPRWELVVRLYNPSFEHGELVLQSQLRHQLRRLPHTARCALCMVCQL